MSVGDMAIFWDGAGAQVPGTAGAKFSYNTTKRNDGMLVTKTSDTDFTVNDPGSYLLLYGFHYRNATNGRCAPYADVRKDAVAVPGTYGSGYCRNTANDEVRFNRLVFLPALTTSNIINIYHRSGSDLMTGGSVANESYVIFIKMPSNQTCAYGLYTEADDVGVYGGTSWTSLEWDTDALQTDTDIIERVSSTTFRLKKLNTRYLVGFSESFWNTAAVRTQRIVRCLANGVEVPGARAFAFIRQASCPFGTAHMTFLVETTSQVKNLVFQAQRGNADLDGTVIRVPTFGQVFIWEIPSGVTTVNYYDNVAVEDLTVANPYLDAARTEIWKGHSHVVRSGSYYYTVDTPVDLLAGLNVFGERTDSSGTRLMWLSRIHSFGTDYPQTLCSGSYLRGNEAVAGSCYESAANMVTAFRASAGYPWNQVWLGTNTDGDVGGTDVTMADRVGSFLLNLSELYDVSEPDYGQAGPVASRTSKADAARKSRRARAGDYSEPADPGKSSGFSRTGKHKGEAD